jgi:hypothetical protein
MLIRCLETKCHVTRKLRGKPDTGSITQGGNLQLFTDDNPETTLKGLGFKNKEKVIESISLIEYTFSKLRDKQVVNTCSPEFLRPRYYLDSKEIIEKFYLQQKMYGV